MWDLLLTSVHGTLNQGFMRVGSVGFHFFPGRVRSDRFRSGGQGGSFKIGQRHDGIC